MGKKMKIGIGVVGGLLVADFTQAFIRHAKEIQDRKRVLLGGGCEPDCKCKCGQVTCGCHIGR